jgi:hypothetical protein
VLTFGAGVALGLADADGEALGAGDALAPGEVCGAALGEAATIGPAAAGFLSGNSTSMICIA